MAVPEGDIRRLEIIGAVSVGRNWMKGDCRTHGGRVGSREGSSPDASG